MGAPPPSGDVSATDAIARGWRLLTFPISMSDDGTGVPMIAKANADVFAVVADERKSEPDLRGHRAWRTWLAALATDAEAAVAAALAYESLPAGARDAWLDALVEDVRQVDVPAVAIYAPLLSVETDARRRARMESAVASAPEGFARQTEAARSLRGVALDGTHACIVVAPLYLSFVHVMWCRYRPDVGLISLRHDPIRHRKHLTDLDDVDGIDVEPTPLHMVVEELAHAIVADRRDNRSPPVELAAFAYLFGPESTLVDDVSDGQLW